jgi:hypothetical protein
LAGGSTRYTEPELDTAALSAVMREWTRTDLDSLSAQASYWLRVSHLENGTGLNAPSFTLKGDGRSAMMFDDGAADVLTGAGGSDWFFASSRSDELTDLNRGGTETVTSSH